MIRVECCAVCRTDLHIVDGDLMHPTLPLIPGHEIVGTIEMVSPDVDGFQPGDLVGVTWLGRSCGACWFCSNQWENLCDRAEFTGYTMDGGFAEYSAVDARYAFHIPPGYDAIHAAPLMCAGVIGYRSYSMTGAAPRIAIYGFGAAAHILAQVALHQGRDIYAFVRPGDNASLEFAQELGVTWAGFSGSYPPREVDAAILFASAGYLVPEALRIVRKGGTVICGGIHMTDVPSFPYQLLWGERSIRSVANLTRHDATSFLDLAGRIPIRTSVEVFPLQLANDALAKLRSGSVRGAAVLVPDHPEGDRR